MNYSPDCAPCKGVLLHAPRHFWFMTTLNLTQPHTPSPTKVSHSIYHDVNLPCCMFCLRIRGVFYHANTSPNRFMAGEKKLTAMHSKFMFTIFANALDKGLFAPCAALDIPSKKVTTNHDPIDQVFPVNQPITKHYHCSRHQWRWQLPARRKSHTALP